MFQFSRPTSSTAGPSNQTSDQPTEYVFGHETASTLGDTQLLIESYLHKELVARGLDTVTGPDCQTYSVSVFVALLPPLPYGPASR
jgi:hypothetical protein